MPFDRAASLTGQILDALGHAHRAGIVHRDLKPANLMLTEAGIVKVMDFGIARVAGTERMTNDGFMVGTPAYMAPEQVRGEEVDGRTDLYAVGVVFYRLLTGKLPFKAETAVAMIQSQLNDQPTPARQVRTDLPDWLDVVLMRSLAKRPGERYQSAEEFRRALDLIDTLPALADDITVATPSAPIALRATGVTPASGRTAGPFPGHDHELASAATPAAASHTTTLVLNRSHLAVAGGFGAMLLVVIGLLGWLALRRPVVTPSQAVSAPAAVPAPPAPAAAPVAASTPVAPAPIAAPPVAASRPAPDVAPPAPSVVPPPKPVKPAVADAVAARPAETTPPPAAGSAVPRTDGVAPPARGGRGAPVVAAARGGRAAAAPPPTVEYTPVVLRKLHAVSVVGGRSSRMVEVFLAFSERGITATDSDSGLTVKTFPYSAVKHATIARLVKPRGAGDITLDTPGGIPKAACSRASRACGWRLKPATTSCCCGSIRSRSARCST